MGEVGRRGKGRENENEGGGGAGEHVGFLKEVCLRLEMYRWNWGSFDWRTLPKLFPLYSNPGRSSFKQRLTEFAKFLFLLKLTRILIKSRPQN